MPFGLHKHLRKHFLFFPLFLNYHATLFLLFRFHLGKFLNAKQENALKFPLNLVELSYFVRVRVCNLNLIFLFSLFGKCIGMSDGQTNNEAYLALVFRERKMKE